MIIKFLNRHEADAECFHSLWLYIIIIYGNEINAILFIRETRLSARPRPPIKRIKKACPVPGRL